MYTATLISVFGSVASPIATIVLTVLADIYVKLSHALVEEAKRAKFASVFVDFFASGNTIEIDLCFRTETGKTVKRHFSIDLHFYSRIFVESLGHGANSVKR
jgi:hypothetical protein